MENSLSQSSLRNPPGLLAAFALLFALGILRKIVFGTPYIGGESVSSLVVNSIGPYLLLGLFFGYMGGKRSAPLIATACLTVLALVVLMGRLKGVGIPFFPVLKYLAPYLPLPFVGVFVGFFVGKTLRSNN